MEYKKQFGPGWEAKHRWPASTPEPRARAEFLAWQAVIENRFATIRASRAADATAVTLTQREADILAGEWYSWFVDQHQDNPGRPERWAGLRETLLDVATDYDPNTWVDGGKNTPVWDPPAEALDAVAAEARTTAFLIDKRPGPLTQSARELFLSAVAREFLAATSLLERRARGDLSEDQHLSQIAPPGASGAAGDTLRVGGTHAAQKHHGPSLSPWALWEAYCLEKKPADGTVESWRGVFKTLEALDKRPHDRDTAQQWLDSLITEERSAGSVRATWLVSVNAVYRWAVKKRKLASNPFEECTVTVPRKVKVREKAFRPHEALTILRAAKAVAVTDAWTAAQRWVPWIAAYTGARVGEMAQLRVKDVEVRDYGPVMIITPDAGTVKTKEARVVPIHEHLVAMGLLEFVEGVRRRLGPDGRLFLNASSRSAARKTAQKLAAWVRSLGVNDPAVDPNHGWRHSFKQKAMTAKIDPRYRALICGHAAQNVGETYEVAPVEDLAKAMEAFPRWKT